MKSSTSTIDSNLNFARRSETVLSVALLAVLMLMVMPLPTVLMDMLLALNLGLTIVLLLTTLSAHTPLDLSVFPSLLLLLTLYRLALNVATTRLILTGGEAGRIVSTFGGLVVGGNLVVGLVIFLILIIIQFVVITKGASRISEVNARFVLDAMPGKQMAIDAEMNSGTIDENDARARRDELAREAEFYGAMDGAGRFVRGDAIAGLIVTAINLFGGIIIGTTSGLNISEAIHRYAILTVGDGLITQIPALIIATTSGILVTKAASDASLGEEIGTQLFESDRALWAAAALMACIAMTPGLPKLPFLILAGGLAALSRMAPAEEEEVETTEEAPVRSPDEDHLDDFLQTDRAGIEIGARLIPLVSPDQTSGLTARVASMRKDLSRKYGFWIPTIRIRDDIGLAPDAYRILIGGREAACGELRTDQLLAINPGKTTLELDGEETVDPAFGLPARWIAIGDRQRAEVGGFTVVDAMTVLITHAGEVLRRYAHELLGREDLKKMIDRVRETAPAIVEELKPEVVRMGVLHQVVRRLLEERVPITNFIRILESVVSHSDRNKDHAVLTECVREDLGRDICERFRNDDGRMQVIVLDPRLEIRFRDAAQNGQVSLTPAELEALLARLNSEWQKATLQHQEVALLTDRSVRRQLRETISRSLPELSVVAYSEVPNETMIEPIVIVGTEDIVPADSVDKPRVSEVRSQANEPIGSAA